MILGHLRQQAIGNISMAIAHGVKIYLYKESIIYKDYKSKGYYIYSIEDDLSEESLYEPIAYEYALHNYRLYKKNEYNKKINTENELKSILGI